METSRGLLACIFVLGFDIKAVPDAAKGDNDQKVEDKAAHVFDPMGKVVDRMEFPVYSHAHKVCHKRCSNLDACVLPDEVDVRLNSSFSCR